ncbi:MAG: UDP-N-acetylmuramate--L-alanine ligase [Anaerolineae bacterium]
MPRFIWQAGKIQPGMRVHLVGIGGVGLSAIARVLLERGFRVSGSDRAANAYTEALARDGVVITIGHEAANVQGADLVIVTSAANAENPEIAAARAASIPVYKRSEIIMDVIYAGVPEAKAHSLFTICVAGTHGKTTTTGMIAHMMIGCGLNPGYIIGGTLSTTGTNGAAGGGDFFVIEADEYDNMYHGLDYDLAVITNIEWDHPDFFKTYDDLQESFRTFVVDSLKWDCCAIVCKDDAGIQQLITRIDAEKVGLQTYGKDSASEIRTDGDTTVFRLADTDHHVRIGLPGMHNVLNALGALQVMSMLPWFNDYAQRFTFAQAIQALETFKGTGRRFEVMGEIARENGLITVINDYAHHPTAIRATLAAAAMRYPGRAIWAVWQPHTFSRTRALWNEYVAAFGGAQHALVTDIYAAREPLDPEITAARLVVDLRGQHPDARHTPSLDDAAVALIASVQAPAVIVIMSAGDAPKIGEKFLKQDGVSGV